MNTAATTNNYELERGKPMPSKNHAIIQSNLSAQLIIHYSKKYRMMTEINLSLPVGKKVPDIAVFNKMKYDGYNDEINMTEMPLCAIEILSPQQGMQELITKAKDYFDAGVKSYWLVLPGIDYVHVFSSPNQHESFSKNEILEDKNLGIKVNLAEVFV